MFGLVSVVQAISGAVVAVLAVGLALAGVTVFWRAIVWLGEALYGKGNFHP